MPEALGADDGRFGFWSVCVEISIRELQRRGHCVRGEIGPGCFVPGLDGSNVDECKKSSEQWNPDLETKPL